jgi:hypothetical protein
LSLIGSWVFVTGFWLILVPSVVLFPDGRPLSNRWLWLLWGSGILISTVQVITIFSSQSVCIDWSAEAVNECIRSVENPLNISSLGGIGETISPVLTAVLFLSAIVSLASLIARFRNSTGDVRQQIKWVTLVVVAGVLPFAVLAVAQEALGFNLPEWLGIVPFLPLNVGIPVAIAVAILKYRLYDIDRIISRTASYAVVAGLLAAIFAGTVALTQQLLSVEGQFGIVVSTLIVAALFNPLRRRVQAAVDRRFNRSRYDAQRVLDEFSIQLREDVDLEPMLTALLRATQETMQPSYVSLWVRERTREG